MDDGAAMTYERFYRTRAVLAALMLGYGAWAIWVFAEANAARTFKVLAIVFWALAPPLWFFLESRAFDRGWIARPADSDKRTVLLTRKYGGLASKIWAMILATLLVLYE
jgi:hypothetical protein